MDFNCEEKRGFLDETHQVTTGMIKDNPLQPSLYFRSNIPKHRISGEDGLHLVFVPDILDTHQGNDKLCSYFLNRYPKRISATQFDWRGCGLSAGPRGHINNWKDLVTDLERIVSFLTENSPDRLLFIGQGIGAASIIMLLTTQKMKWTQTPLAIFLNPILSPSWDDPVMVDFLGKSNSTNFSLNKIKVGASSLIENWTNDRDYLRMLLSDTTINRELSLSFFKSIREIASRTINQAYFFDNSSLFILSKVDPLNEQRLTQLFVKGIPNEDVRVLEIDINSHDLFNVLPKHNSVLVVDEWVRRFLK